MNCVIQRLKTLDPGQKHAGMTSKGNQDGEVIAVELYSILV